jgi:hypothetical protein
MTEVAAKALVRPRRTLRLSVLTVVGARIEHKILRTLSALGRRRRSQSAAIGSGSYAAEGRMRSDDGQFLHPVSGNKTGRDTLLGWHTPVRFDPNLLRQLLAQHDALDRDLASLPDHAARDRDEAERIAVACACQLHELRRQESLWIYPLMTRHFDGDPIARRRLLNLRFVMNSLARRVLRQIDELTRALHQAGDIRAAAAAVTAALADYRQRNESELYTLYGLMDPRDAAGRRKQVAELGVK